jgi:hypothetical protein
MFPECASFFLIAGAGKSGTTALAEVMSRAPDIAFSRIKEPRFFVHQTGYRSGGSRLGPPNSGNWQRGISYYADLFDFSTAPVAFGEASTAYFYCHESPELIAHFRPDARMIFLLRDPVARVQSQYRHEVKVGRRLRSLSKMVARRDDPNLERYLWGSRYATHLARYLRWFPPEQLFVLEYDAFFAAPRDSYRAVRRFLGLSEDIADSADFKRVNTARQPNSRLIASGMRTLSHARLGDWVPSRLRSHASVLKRQVEYLNSRPAGHQALSRETTSGLLERLEGETDRLREVIETAPACLQGNLLDTSHWLSNKTAQ